MTIYMKNNILVNILCVKLICYELLNHIYFSLNTVWILYKLTLAPWKSARSLKGTDVNNATQHFYFMIIISFIDLGNIQTHNFEDFYFDFNNSPAISAEVLQRCPNLFPNCSTFPNPQAHSSSVIFRIFCTVFNQSFIVFGVIELYGYLYF